MNKNTITKEIYTQLENKLDYWISVDLKFSIIELVNEFKITFECKNNSKKHFNIPSRDVIKNLHDIEFSSVIVKSTLNEKELSKEIELALTKLLNF